MLQSRPWPSSKWSQTTCLDLTYTSSFTITLDFKLLLSTFSLMLSSLLFAPTSISVTERPVRSASCPPRSLADQLLWRLVHIIRLPFHNEFGGIVPRIESRTKVVDDLASALSQVRAAEFFNGKLPRKSSNLYILMIY